MPSHLPPSSSSLTSYPNNSLLLSFSLHEEERKGQFYPFLFFFPQSDFLFFFVPLVVKGFKRILGGALSMVTLSPILTHTNTHTFSLMIFFFPTPLLSLPSPYMRSLCRYPLSFSLSLFLFLSHIHSTSPPALLVSC